MKYICKTCKAELINLGIGHTLLGWGSPNGHTHDVNTFKRYFRCSNCSPDNTPFDGPSVNLRIRCGYPGCGWESDYEGVNEWEDGVVEV